jgi:hypothetical protein
MKSNYHYLLCGFLCLLFLSDCKEENPVQDQQPLVFSGRFLNISDCKSGKSTEVILTDIPDTATCVDYSYSSVTHELLMKHINAGFNCCPDSVYTNFALSNDTIIIEEKETASLCNCNCLYDLTIVFLGVEKKKYFIRFIEPYTGDQEKLEFDLDLINNDSTGSYCLTRKQYPWIL